MNENPIYVIGHKNPDPDSICAAIAYTHLKEMLGISGYIPACCGSLNVRIEAILEHLNVQPPVFISDVTPRLEDIMTPVESVQYIHPETTYAKALEIVEKHDLTLLPVLDQSFKLLGIISVFQLGEYFIPKPSAPDSMRFVNTCLEAVAQALNAQIHHLENPKNMENLCLRVGAMHIDSFDQFDRSIALQTIVVVGNREDIQQRSIELGVRLLVITGKVSPSEAIIAFAKKHKVSLIQSGFDIAATAWIIRAATPIKPIITKNAKTFSATATLASVKQALSREPSSVYCVTDESNRLLGVFTKSDILKPAKTQLVLVDHNELSQAVDGASEVSILEIIDHHRLGNPPTQAPIRFINEPWGSTCTIVANMYRTHDLEPSQTTAGLLMGGIITDTLNLSSPTTTSIDKELLPWLGKLAKIDPKTFAQKIFNSGSIIVHTSAEDAIRTDCKIYTESNLRFSAAQIEELGFDNFWKAEKQLFTALENYKNKEKLDFSVLLVTDINTQNSLLLITENAPITQDINYPCLEQGNIFELKGIVSRKKQLIPYLTRLLEEVHVHRPLR